MSKKSVLAQAMLEDESVRIASQNRSDEYLKKKEEDDGVPFWMWCILWFILGMFTYATIPTSIASIILSFT